MKRFILLVLHYLAVPFVLLSLGFKLIGLKKKWKKFIHDPNAYAPEERYRYVYSLIKRVLFIKNIKVQATGFNKIPKRPVLFVCNHKSNADPFVLLKILFETQGITFFNFISKVENKKSKVVNRIADLIETIYIDRGNLRQQYEVYNEQLNRLKEQKSIVIYPEMHRIYEDKFATFQPAALRAAFHSFVPIQPVVIYGSSGLLDKNKQFASKKRIVYLKALPMLQHKDFCNSSEAYIAEQLEKSMQAEYDKMKELDSKNALKLKEE
ncbi:MAG: 1-acyl-sn-glycerol-3-phosphate acyltransferase [Mycoplasmataceae bacterium]|nr:1-acyl-sn-glycerol-3-phosphate acyltransferase [Mycoplasmataceae bacterium]